MQQRVGVPLLEAAGLAGTTIAANREPESRFVSIDGLRVHYLDFGGEARPQMVCIHARRQHAHLWGLTGLAFSDRYRVRSLDFRGHGDSQWDPQADYGLKAFEKELEVFVDALGIQKFVLVSLSMATRVALKYAAHHPERVSAMILGEPSIEATRQEGAKTGGAGWDARQEIFDSFEDFVQQARKERPYRKEWLVRFTLGNSLRQMPDGRWTWKYDPIQRDLAWRARLIAEDYGESLWEQWSQAKCPSLIVKGGRSKMTSYDILNKMKATNALSQLVEVPEAGHFVPEDNPRGWEDALRLFLQRVERPGS